MMSHSNNDQRVTVLSNDHVIGKPAQDKSLRARSTRVPGHIGEGDNVLLQQIQRRLKCLSELDAQACPLFLVPGSSLDRLIRSFFKDSYSSHYRWPSRSLSFRVSSSRSMSFAVPESMARTRRRISLSHSLAA